MIGDLLRRLVARNWGSIVLSTCQRACHAYHPHDGLASQVAVGPAEGLKHDSSIHCDELVSLPKSALSNFIGMLPPSKIEALNRALRVALARFSTHKSFL